MQTTINQTNGGRAAGRDYIENQTKNINVEKVTLYNPFNMYITTNNSQLIYLKFFSNINNYNFIKIFNRILILSYLLFVIYFSIFASRNPVVYKKGP